MLFLSSMVTYHAIKFNVIGSQTAGDICDIKVVFYWDQPFHVGWVG